MTFFEDAYCIIHQGDALDILATLPEESVQAVVTSPPYWGLRRYSGEQERIWGGDPDCANHAELPSGEAQGETYVGKRRWQHAGVSRQEAPEEWVDHGSRGKSNWDSFADYRVAGDNRGGKRAIGVDSDQGATCARCGAWRGAYGLEPTVEMYVEHTIEFLRAIRRVLRADGVVFWNIGDSYAGSWGNYSPGGIKGKQRPQTEQGQRWERGAYEDTTFLPPTANSPGLKPKDLVLMPFRVALAAQGYVTVQVEQMWDLAEYLDQAADDDDWEAVRLAANTLRVWAWGQRIAKADKWWVRSVIIWHKRNPMPASCQDRPTDAYEFVLMLAKDERYYWDQEAVREVSLTGDNRRPYTSQGAWEIDERPESQRHGGEQRTSDSSGRNLRNVWTFATQPFGMEMCKACKRVYTAAQYHRLPRGKTVRCQHPISATEKCEGTEWRHEHGRHECLSCGTVYVSKSSSRGRKSRVSPEMMQELIIVPVETIVQKDFGKLPTSAVCHCGRDDAWLSHFASYPEELVERCVKAATSERGCCPKCGRPWERVMERGSLTYGGDGHRRPSERQKEDSTNLDAWARPNGLGKTQVPSAYYPIATLGWQPGCQCDAVEPVPCTVLDPFTGSGTTNWVAKKMGRRSIGIELSEDYCRLAVEQLRQGVLL